jgi:hypothetical protein
MIREGLINQFKVFLSLFVKNEWEQTKKSVMAENISNEAE